MIRRNVILPLAIPSLSRATSAAAAGLCAALLGCSDDSINMGEGVPVVESSELPLSSHCAENPVLEGDVLATNQEEVDALEGCEVIDGGLVIAPFEGAHLRALHALREVSGELVIGGVPSGIAQEQTEEQHEESHRLQMLQSAWLPSLEGLESLETAGALRITGLLSEALEPLGNLRRLTYGSLSIGSAQNLRDFDGLQKLEGVRHLSVGASRRLKSFDGLTLPPAMGSMQIENADLTELQPLGVTSIETLSLFDNRLRDLRAFESLEAASSISIIANRKLESLSGLENLRSLRSLEVEYNVALTDIPDFENVPSLETLKLVVNPALPKVPALPNLVQFQPSTGGSLTYEEQRLRFRPDIIQIYGMDSVTKLTLPAGWQSASMVWIQGNANLREVEFTEQTYVDYLAITDNPLLESVETGALDKVNVLNLAENPVLPANAFEGIRVLDTTSEAGSAP